MAFNQEEVNEIGNRFKKHKITDWKIEDCSDLCLVEKMSGKWDFQTQGGSVVKLEDLSAKQEAAIRKEFNLKGGESGSDYDANLLIPSDGELGEVKRQQKKDGKKNPYDENPMIPD